ncbi:hypothetical protein IB244_31485 [Rhizobium sp. RHZ02]|uniref:hypothetical protein n=1 Tax=Rhizobium sp. RHZ02 TaxID=2769306 RepID=UPI00177BB3B6|nr:hypothetical protein [Rhizobium sp. RHZ02]MBD9455993.1 hypothetical protein [Rhizobium sp. RHZ02]
MNKKDEATTDRIRLIRKKYPPVPMAPFLAMQRRWIRRVNQMTSMTHVQRCAAVFIGAFGTPDAPFCATSMDYICKHVGCERTAVHKAVKFLEGIGYMAVDRQKRAGNVYRIQVPI